MTSLRGTSTPSTGLRARTSRARRRLAITLSVAMVAAVGAIGVAATPATATTATASPASGPLAGGNTVTVTGAEFAEVTSVTVNNVGAHFSMISPTQVHVTMPQMSAPIATSIVVHYMNMSLQSVTESAAYTYGSAPAVSAISPTSGTTAGGTLVTITGSNFAAGNSVTFGGTAATGVTVISSTQMTVLAPARAAGAASVVVSDSYGSSGGITYTYDTPPVLTSLSTSTGPTAGGNTVTLNGANFTSTSTVKFGSTTATVTAATATTLTAVAPAGSGTVSVQVTNTYGTATLSNSYTYVAGPGISSFTPNHGTSAGGTSVTITGTGFTGISSVTFGGVATSFTVNSSTSITTKTPAGPVGSTQLAVKGTYGTATSTYIYDGAPTISTVSPNQGAAAGGTSVVITGTNFKDSGGNTLVTGATGVTFGGTNATSYTVDSATQITATTPAKSAGVYNVVVTSSVSAVTASNAYTFDAAPTISSVSPSAVTASTTTGGVVLNGSNLTGATGVSVSGTAATITSNSASQIIFTAPSKAAGTYDVTVTTTGGSYTLSHGLTYVASPVLTGISPNRGTTSGGTTVTLTGSNFTGVTSVTFGGTKAASFTINSAGTQITAVTASHAAGGVDVAMTESAGTVTFSGVYTYGAPPTLTSISPTSGPSAGGTTVTINGTNLTGATAVTFAGAAASSFSVNSAGTVITAVTAPGTPGAATVSVTTPYGGYSLSSAYTFVAAPAITSLSTTTGSTAGGTSVTITGTNLSSASAVHFGSSTGTITANSSTSITATTPAGSAGVVNVSVTTANGTGTDYNAFTYGAPPTISSLSPTTGNVAGGSTITITGTNLTGATHVTFGGTNATSYTVNSATQITAVSPAGTAGTASVMVTTPYGSVTNSSFSYGVAPTVTLVTPAIGATTGGNTVVINGANLNGASGAAGVKFGSTNATSYTVNSSTQITAVAPAGSAGVVSISVTTGDGTGTMANAYTYGTIPSITSLSPTSGTTAGGTSVVITGAGFSGATAVKFGTTNATSYTVNSSTQITAVAPAGAAGAGNVTVTTGYGTSAASSWTYDAPPTVTSVTANTGSTNGGTTVTIAGTNLGGTTGVTFGGTAGTSIVNTSSTSITVVTPSHAAGAVNVVVTTAYGSGTGTSAFTYVVPPAITSLSVTTGSTAGGTSVVIYGSGFTGATVVEFGSVHATSFTVNSATQITAVAPAASASTVSVSVTTPYGTGTKSSAYTYGTPPTVTSVSPNAGTTAGGKTVTITGTNLTGATTVDFGGSKAQSFTVNSATSITAVTPSGVAGAASVQVITPYGSSTLSNAFTYGTPPVITSVSPNFGTADTTTANVVITGSNLAGSYVTFAGLAATITGSTATTLTVTAPSHAAGVVSVEVQNAFGSSTLSNAFTYGSAPALTAINVTSGTTSGGTTVVLTGANLTGATHLTFGGTNATSYTVNSATQITAVTPSHASGAATVQVTTAYGTSNLPIAYTYVTPPTLSGISPSSGTTLGGTIVTISGANLSGTTHVTFGGTNATSFSVNSSTSITATAPSHAAGAATIQVTNAYGSPSLTNAYTYDAPPTITSLSPTKGPADTAGMAVTIYGTGFTSNSTAYFGGVIAPTISFVSSTTLIVSAPSYANATVSVNVVTPYGSTTKSNAYTFGGAPTITSVSPSSGTAGTSHSGVIIYGTNFSGATAVTVDSTSATFTVNSDDQITMTAPSKSAGSYTVAVTTPLGTASRANGFTYGSTPAVQEVEPSTGSTAGGETITITGSGFTGTTGVSIGGTAATSYSVISSTEVTAVVPAHAAGAVSVQVTNGYGTGTLSSGFTYGAAPTVSHVTADTGTNTGGQSVVIMGTGFTGASKVTFGGTPATSYTVVNSTEISAVTPAHVDGDVPVAVTTGYGTGSLANAYTFGDVPTITSISPDSDGVNVELPGIVITGTNLLNGTVTFDGYAATVTSNENTSLTVTAPAHAAGAVDVVVTTPFGSVTDAHGFAYGYVPLVDEVLPSTGPTSGGRRVVINGNNFSSVTQVLFNGVAGTSLTLVSPTQLSVVTPANSAGAVAVAVTNEYGTGTLADAYTYGSAPTLSAVTPDEVTTSGGQTITITGTNLTDTTNVLIGGEQATNVTVVSPTSVTATAPAASAGTVTLAVRTSYGVAAMPLSFSYVTPTPTGGGGGGGSASTDTTETTKPVVAAVEQAEAAAQQVIDQVVEIVDKVTVPRKLATRVTGFAPNSAELTRAMKSSLAKYAKRLKAGKLQATVVTGVVQVTTADSSAVILADARAKSVIAYLRKLGVKGVIKMAPGKLGYDVSQPGYVDLKSVVRVPKKA